MSTPPQDEPMHEEDVPVGAHDGAPTLAPEDPPHEEVIAFSPEDADPRADADATFPAPQGYDFFADVEGTRSLAHTLEAGVQFGTLLNTLGRLEDTLHRLPSRLQGLHERGVRVPTDLGAAVSQGTHRLRQASAQARDRAERSRTTLDPALSALWARIEANDAAISGDGYAAHAEEIAVAKAQGEVLRGRLEGAEAEIHACFADLIPELRALEGRAHVLERAADALERATFTLQPGEALVAATEGTYHLSRKEAADGTLFLTDRRLLFEQREQGTQRVRFLPFARPRLIVALRLDEPLAHIAGADAAPHEGRDRLHIRFTKGAKVSEASFTVQGGVEEWVGMIAKQKV